MRIASRFSFLLAALYSFFSLFAGAETAPFEIRNGDRVLFLGDTLLERENTFAYLETRLHEQFPDRTFTVRNLSWAGDTPTGWSRASFDPASAGIDRLKEHLALVKPTVVFLGYGMAASLQEMTDRSHDWTLNPDPARYGAEPMTGARFKTELAALMDLIGKDVRFVLLSPIRHEDLRLLHSGLPDPTEHNNLLEIYQAAVEGLAEDRGARLVAPKEFIEPAEIKQTQDDGTAVLLPRAMTDNGIHLNEAGYKEYVAAVARELGWSEPALAGNQELQTAIRTAVLRKNDLFFHRFRPANSTYLFGFRKHEQGQNAKEMVEFEPLITAADAEIDRVTRGLPKTASESAPAAPSQPAPAVAASTSPAPTKPVPPLTQGAPAEPAAPAPASPTQPSDATQSQPSPVTPPANPKDFSTAGPIGPPPVFTIQDGLEISLWAETPFLGKPTQMAWDGAGRLWVACTPIYPQIEPGARPDDKVVILEDTNHDGKADKSTTFADELLIPSGVAVDTVDSRPVQAEAPAPKADGTKKPFKNQQAASSAKVRNAAYVAASTELLYLADTNGDGKADTRRIVLSGFGTEDTHHNVHTLRWGPDGRLYFNQSVYPHTHLETPWGMVRLNSGGVFAYDPRTERVEVFCKGLWNPWGHTWDRWGQSFLTDGAGFSGLAWAFPGAVFAPSEGARKTMATISPGTYPKFAGLEIIDSPHFPADWQGTAVTCDFRAHRVVRFAIDDFAPGKSGYITRELPDILRTPDLSFRPIDVRIGPDGALYIADWTNPVINHGEVDFRDPRRDHIHGRIWRITMKDRPLAKALPKPSRKEREKEKEKEAAKRSLAGGSEFIGDLFTALSDPTPGERTVGAAFGLRNAERISRAEVDQFWRLQWEAEKEARGGDSDRVEKARKTLEMMNRISPMPTELVLNKIESLSPHQSRIPRVRIEAMRRLAREPSVESVDAVLEAALNAPDGDEYYNFAAWRSINDLADFWMAALASGEWKADTEEKQKGLAWGLGAIRPEVASATVRKLMGAGEVPLDGSGPWIELIGQAGDAAALQKLWDPIVVGYAGDCCENDETRALAEHVHAFPSNAVAQRAMNALLEAARTRGGRPAQRTQLAPVLFHADDPFRTGAVELAGLWRSIGAVEKLPELLGERDLPPATRRAVYRTLRAIGTAPARALIEANCAPAASFLDRREAVAALAALDFKKAATFLPDVLKAAPDEAAALPLWRDLIALKGVPDQLAASLPSGIPEYAAAAGLRAAREAGKPAAKLAAALAPTTSGTATAPSQNFMAIAELVKRDGDPARGEEIYRRAALACSTCHAIGGAGGKVGPELGTIGASAPMDYIIESLLVPAAKVKEGYNGVSFTLKDGTVIAGILVRESADEFVVRGATGAEQSVSKTNVTARDNIGSLMPAGLTAQLSGRELQDLVAFLAQLGKAGAYDASKANVARTWWLTGADTAHLVAVYTNVDGTLPHDRLTAVLPMVQGATVQAATKLTAAAAGKTRLNLAGVREASLDGKALPVASEPNPTVTLTAGEHTLTVTLDPKSLPAALRVEADSVRFLNE